MKNQLRLASGILIISMSMMFAGCKGNTQKENAGEKVQVVETIYTCPMHPEIEKNKPGDCPICGMALVEKKTEKPQEEKMHD